jgi:hypothetical protein
VARILVSQQGDLPTGPAETHQYLSISVIGSYNIPHDITAIWKVTFPQVVADAARLDLDRLIEERLADPI